MMYNIRKFHYADGVQVRLYKKAVVMGVSNRDYQDCVDFLDDNDSERGNEENKKHSQYVSMARSKQMIYGIARSNEWKYFLTLTFDRTITDSSDYGLVVKRAQNWLHNISKRICPNLKYLVVPELHADGKHWHLHGLLSGCDELTLKDSGHKTKNGMTIYNLLNWRFGFSTVTRIQDKNRVSAYISKYITKELVSVTKGRQRYWASNNVIRPSELCEHDFDSRSFEEILKAYSKDANYITFRESFDGSQKIYFIEIKPEN